MTPPAPGHGVFDHLLGQESWRSPTGDEIDVLLARLAGPEGLTAGASTFERRDVVAAVAEAVGKGRSGGRDRVGRRSIARAS